MEANIAMHGVLFRAAEKTGVMFHSEPCLGTPFHTYFSISQWDGTSVSWLGHDTFFRAAWELGVPWIQVRWGNGRTIVYTPANYETSWKPTGDVIGTTSGLPLKDEHRKGAK